MKPIDLRSDTVTRPTDGMREAIARADVGDDVYGEDPTTRALEERAAELVGQARALLVPSGTMANQIAIRAHTEPGDAMLVGEGAHTYLYEGGGAAALAGVHSVIVGQGGMFGVEDVRQAIYPDDPHYARTRLICLENTHNRSGGRVFPQEQVTRIAKAAREADLRLHLDGARIFNAAVATGRSAAELCEPFDSVAFCLSKGLGAPAGSLICGSEAFVARARRIRKLLGGALRQAGILAAAGVYALDHHLKRLGDDHATARLLAEGLRSLAGVEAVDPPETNIVRLRVADAPAWVERARGVGVWVGAIDACHVRAVTHLEIGRADVEAALERLRAAP